MSVNDAILLQRNFCPLWSNNFKFSNPFCIITEISQCTVLDPKNADSNQKLYIKVRNNILEIFSFPEESPGTIIKSIEGNNQKHYQNALNIYDKTLVANDQPGTSGCSRKIVYNTQI